jgi:peptidyl-tRNA hydrolase ICT1
MALLLSAILRHAQPLLRASPLAAVASSLPHWPAATRRITFITAGTPATDVEIPRGKVEAAFSRSSGAGGQNVNKLNTKAELRFHVEDADWLDNHTKARLATLYRGFVNAAGQLVVTSQRHRTQEANLEDAFGKLRAMVAEAAEVPRVRHQRTGLSELTRKEYREDKRHRADVKTRRKSRPDGDDWGD